MREKAFVTMFQSAVINIVIGVIVLITGIVSGTLLLVSGARLMKNKSGITF